jgi:hypothetical protein
MGKTYNWNTVHDTANRTMTHEFEMGFAVVVDWKNTQIMTTRDGALVTKVDFKENKLSLDDYENILVKVQASVEQLKSFQNVKND